MAIKLVAWDVYGTLIASSGDESCDVEDNERTRLRPYALESLDLIKSRGIRQITISDGEPGRVISSLEKVRVSFGAYFHHLHKMLEGSPKDVSQIIEQYLITPPQLLVIGDNYPIDLALAKKLGCQVLHVPENPAGFSPLPISEIESMLG